jgi:hypothetical protein
MFVIEDEGGTQSRGGEVGTMIGEGHGRTQKQYFKTELPELKKIITNI